MDIEKALLLFDSAQWSSIRPNGCTLVLSFLPYIRASVRRKKVESFSAMLQRAALKAQHNKAHGIEAASISSRRACVGCGQTKSLKLIKCGLLCADCRKGLREIRAEAHEAE